jgi:hypothetical protein
MKDLAMGTPGGRPDPGAVPGDRSPLVFVSYAHESEHHKEQVHMLCAVLRECGIDTDMDRWADGRRRDWDAWAKEQINAADFILVAASPGYKRAAYGDAAPGDRSGVQAEASLLRDKLSGDRQTWLRKILPVILPGYSKDDIPDFLLPNIATWYKIPGISRDGIDELLRALTGQPRDRRPPLGPFRTPGHVAAAASGRGLSSAGSVPGVRIPDLLLRGGRHATARRVPSRTQCSRTSPRGLRNSGLRRRNGGLFTIRGRCF